MKCSTELGQVRSNPKCFTWGDVKEILDLGPYTFVRYIDQNGSQYHIYVEGVDTCKGASSLESAMVQAIAIKNMEPNAARWMSEAALKLLGVSV